MKTIRTRTILILFLIAHAAYFAMGFIVPAIEAGTSVRLFDLRMFVGYDFSYAQTFVSELSDNGRLLYFRAQVPLDIVYPVAAGMFFSLLFLKLTGSRTLAAMGVVSLVCDLLENALVVAILTTTPLAHAVVSAASFATIAKGYAYVLNYGITLFLLARLAVMRFRKRRLASD